MDSESRGVKCLPINVLIAEKLIASALAMSAAGLAVAEMESALASPKRRKSRRKMIRKKRAKEELTIDLTGPNGNAFFLLGTASKVAKQIGLDEPAIIAEMKTGDYENLVQVFDKYFGHIFTLLR